MEWHPASISDVTQILEGDLVRCDSEQLGTFRKYSVKPYLAPILRYGRLESVVVVARRADEVIYWEDVEEGFNVSPIATDGQILQHSCNQDELGLALNCWIEGRKRPAHMGPAQRLI